MITLVALAGCTVDNRDFDPSVAWPPAIQDGAPPAPDGGPAQDSRTKSTPFSCTPFSFVSCQSDQLMLRCGVKGKGVETVPCTHGCNSTTQQCNQCIPSGPAFCSKDVKVVCSATGELSKETCKYGCHAGQCKDCTKKVFFKDADADGFGDSSETKLACELPDGYSANYKDCDDALGEVRPNQTSFFKDPVPGTKSFDYNCDNKAELERPTGTLGSCARVGAMCVGSGWLLLVPPCGGAGFYMECTPKGSSPKDGCKENLAGAVQRCR